MWRTTTTTAKGKPVPSAIATLDGRKAAFLDALKWGASVARAAAAAGVCREQPYAWRRADPAFASAWRTALEAGTDALEDLALEFAGKGSERLLIFLLKARRPEVYRERYLPQQGEAGGQVVFRMVVGEAETGDGPPLLEGRAG